MNKPARFLAIYFVLMLFGWAGIMVSMMLFNIGLPANPNGNMSSRMPYVVITFGWGLCGGVGNLLCAAFLHTLNRYRLAGAVVAGFLGGASALSSFYLGAYLNIAAIALLLPLIAYSSVMAGFYYVAKRSER